MIVVGLVAALVIGGGGLFGTLMLYSRGRRKAKFNPAVDPGAKHVDAEDQALLKELLSAAPTNGAVAGGDAMVAWARGQKLLEAYQGDHPTLKLAAQAFGEALKHDPQLAPAWAGLAEACLLACYSHSDGFGDVYWRGGLAQAERLADRALELRPDDGDAIAVKASYRRLRGYVDEAEALLKKGDENHWHVAQVKAGCFSDRDDYNAWLAELKRATENAPRGRQAKLYNAWGSALSKLFKFSLAIEAFDHALTLEPRYAWAWHNRAIALMRAGRKQEALESSNKALEIGDFAAARELNERLKRQVK
jgi:tetratricopeptide (TPR) repeat protein